MRSIINAWRQMPLFEKIFASLIIIFIVTIISFIPSVIHDKINHETVCQAKGGVWFEVRGGYICLSKDAVIKTD